jgi:very-short-patch-repair endonuclease
MRRGCETEPDPLRAARDQRHLAVDAVPPRHPGANCTAPTPHSVVSTIPARPLRALVDKLLLLEGECRPTAWVEPLREALVDKCPSTAGVCRPVSLDWLLAALAELQYGVVARWQLTLLGYGKTAIQNRVDSGLLIPLHAGVYAVGHTKLTRSGYFLAAVLAFGPRAVLSHRSAGVHWDLLSSRQIKVDVTTHVSGQRHTRRIKAHRTRHLHEEDWTIKDGIPVTSVARTILDLAAVLSRDRLLDLIDDAVRAELFDLGALERAMTRTPKRRGVKKLQAVLADYRGAPDLRSKFERHFRHRLRAIEGLAEPLHNIEVAGYRADVYFPDYKLVIELDSRHFHLTPRAFESDAVRDTARLKQKIGTLRITDERFYSEPDAVIKDVLALTVKQPRA